MTRIIKRIADYPIEVRNLSSEFDKQRRKNPKLRLQEFTGSEKYQAVRGYRAQAVRQGLKITYSRDKQKDKALRDKLRRQHRRMPPELQDQRAARLRALHQEPQENHRGPGRP